MTTPQMQAWLDQEDSRISATVRQHGWAIEYVGGAGRAVCGCPDECAHTRDDEEAPPFAYTIGLFGMGHPELLILGTPMDTALGVLNELGERIRSGSDLMPGELVTFDQWRHRIVPEEVPNPGEIVFGANRHYRRPSEVSVPVLQLSYDDPLGRFPWEEDYLAPEMQPRPGTFRA